MRKIFYLFLCILCIFSRNTQLFASNNLNIISREEWGANEEYRYIDSDEWKNIANTQANENKLLTDDEIEYKQSIFQKEIDAEKYLQTFFSGPQTKTRITQEENGRELLWPIEHSKTIKGIVVHHTVIDNENMQEAVREIYKFHAIDRKWGDIGYNFLIGKNGEIYEGRAGGENTIAGHDKWNNVGNIGIGLIGDYSEEAIGDKQKESLKQLMKYLIGKYNIDINTQNYFHRECIENCNNILESYLLDPIIGHREAGHTGCPGDKLYDQLIEIRAELKNEINFIKIIEDKINFLSHLLDDNSLQQEEGTLQFMIKKSLFNYSKKNNNISIIKEILYEIHIYLKK